MVPSGNVVLIDLQPFSLTTQCGTENTWNRRQDTHCGNCGLTSEPAIGRKSSPSSDVKDSDIHRAVAAFADLPSSTLPDSPSFSRWGRQQPKMPTTNWHLSTKSSGGMGTHPMRKQGSCDPWTDASRPTSPHPKDGGEMLIAIVLDRPLAAPSISGRPCSFHSRNDQDSARKAKSSTYCANDQASRK